MSGIIWPNWKKVVQKTGIVLLWSSVLAAIVTMADFFAATGLQFVLHFV